MWTLSLKELSSRRPTTPGFTGACSSIVGTVVKYGPAYQARIPSGMRLNGSVGFIRQRKNVRTDPSLTAHWFHPLWYGPDHGRRFYDPVPISFSTNFSYTSTLQKASYDSALFNTSCGDSRCTNLEHREFF